MGADRANCTIYEALFRAKQAMSTPKKTTKNEFFKSTYANLGEVMNAAIPALNDAGIVVVERIVNVGTNPETADKDSYLQMTLVLVSDSKETITSSWPLIPVPDKHGHVTPQGLGSALTYGRRYCLQTMCSLSAEDDDGNATSKPRGRKHAKPKTEPVTTPSEARKEVNTQLWKKLWIAAIQAGMNPEMVWDAVWAVRPKLKVAGSVNQTQAMIIVGQLTEIDFKKLWDGVGAFAEAQKRDSATYDPETGEMIPDREPGSDDE